MKSYNRPHTPSVVPVVKGSPLKLIEEVGVRTAPNAPAGNSVQVTMEKANQAVEVLEIDLLLSLIGF